MKITLNDQSYIISDSDLAGLDLHLVQAPDGDDSVHSEIVVSVPHGSVQDELARMDETNWEDAESLSDEAVEAHNAVYDAAWSICGNVRKSHAPSHKGRVRMANTAVTATVEVPHGGWVQPPKRKRRTAAEIAADEAKAKADN